tara:strand:+ start:634 stop:1446 length:813 start_codon:yes stop_codon:yes gene_type:complete
MAINLTYDPANDPDTIEAEDQRDAEALEIGEKLADEQEKLLAGKYKDAEDLEAAYIELQKKLGSQEETTEEETTETKNEVEEKEEEDDIWKDDSNAQAVLKAAGEYDKDGEVSEETIEALAQLDSRDLIDAYYRIQESLPADESEPAPSNPLTDADIDDIQNAVGGEQAYKNMTAWAQENFTAEEIQAYDQALEAGNLNNINFALQALYYRYTDAVGSEGEMIQGKASTAQDGFRSQQEVVRAMGDPRYENDPAYRQDVYDKLERSNIKF